MLGLTSAASGGSPLVRRPSFPAAVLILCLVFVFSLGAAGSRAEPPPARGVTVRVEPVFGAEPVAFDTRSFLTLQGDTVRLTTCRFYLTDLRLRYADGTTAADPERYHLVDADLEMARSRVLRFPEAPAKPIVAITFGFGVDSATNVGGALGGALDPALGMYWAWQSGYINAKLEGTSPSRPAAVRHAFAFHVGGYARPTATRRLITLTLPTPTVADSLTILADIGRWLGAAPLAATADVLVPGPAAVAQADRVAAMFALKPFPAAALRPASRPAKPGGASSNVVDASH